MFLSPAARAKDILLAILVWSNATYNPREYNYVYAPAKTGEYPNDISQFSKPRVLRKVFEG